MLIILDERSDQPLYAQIADCVREGIARGDIAVGERLAPARELAGDLEVHMHTVLRAYGELRAEGLVDMRRGRGVTVLRQPSLDDLKERVAALVAEARSRGLQPRDIRALWEASL